MAYFDGYLDDKAGRIGGNFWRWESKIVWSPFVKCQKSNKRLFPRKAYHGFRWRSWEVVEDKWLSEKEYMLALLREEI
jgi:hypothetical protein